MIRTRQQGDTPFFPNMLNNGKVEVCLKEDVDKILAEKDKVISNREYEIKILKDTLDRLLKSKIEQIIHEVIQNTLIYGEGFIRVEDAMKLVAATRHHKYKRCLSMADYCYTNVHCIMGHRLCSLAHWKKEWFERWHKRWLELAEKFKEAK